MGYRSPLYNIHNCSYAAIKSGEHISEEKGNETLEKQRKQTLGPLINQSKSLRAFPPELKSKFDVFLKERNWLVHRCVIDEYLSIRNTTKKELLFKRINRFNDDAQLLRREVHQLMEKWYVQKGYDINLVDKLSKKILRDAEK